MAWKRHWIGWKRWRKNNAAREFLANNPDLIARAVGVVEGDYEALTEIVTKPIDKAELERTFALLPNPADALAALPPMPKIRGPSRKQLTPYEVRLDNDGHARALAELERRGKAWRKAALGAMSGVRSRSGRPRDRVSRAWEGPSRVLGHE